MPLLPSEKATPPAPKAAELCWVIRHQLQQAPGTRSHFLRSWVVFPASVLPLELWWGTECSMSLLCQLSFFLCRIRPVCIYKAFSRLLPSGL